MTLVEMIRTRRIWKAATATLATSTTEATRCPLSVAGGTTVETRPARESDRVVIEPAAPNARPIYWETGTGQILGPAVPEFLARDGRTFWISMTFEEQIRWINADRLRSRQAFEEQVQSTKVELVKELR